MKGIQYRPCGVRWCVRPARLMSKIPECEYHHRLYEATRRAAMDALIATLKPVKIPYSWHAGIKIPKKGK